MTQLLPFGVGDDLINPDEIYKISRVTVTVTMTLRLIGMGAGSIFTEDFVFGSEQDAIDAVEEFAKSAAAPRLTLEQSIGLAATGMLANQQITKGSLRNTSYDETKRVEAMVKSILTIGIGIQLGYELI